MPEAANTVFSCKELFVQVARRRLVDSLSLNVSRGELIAVLGQNGSGKSITLHTIAGLRPPQSGSIQLLGDDVTSSKRQALARHMALLPQHVDDVFPSSVLDTALIGRHPHIGRFGWESTQDKAVARAALAAVDLGDLASRNVLTLSGGERRRLAIAQVLTQTPDLYLLDEPTNHLDPQHQLDALRLFREKADQGAAVIASLHDVNLAVRFADRCLLLYGDGRWELGTTATILDAKRLSKLYATPMEALQWRNRTLFIASENVTA